jgi:methyltransferase (TIGR00027 family)
MKNVMDEVSADGCVVVRTGGLAWEMGIVDPYAGMFITEAGKSFFETAKKVDPYYEPHNLCRFKFTTSLIENLPLDIKQTVFLGAGFDCRAFFIKRLAVGDMPVFEVDTHSQIRIKTSVLKANCISIPEHIRLIPYDLNNGGLAEKLLETGYEHGRKSLLLMEGLLFTLKPEAIWRLIDPENLKLPKGSILIFDYWKASRIKRLNALLMKSIGRSFFLEPDFDEDDGLFAGRLRSLGYSDVHVTSIDDLVCSYLEGKFPGGCDSGWRVVRAVR